MEKKTKKLKKLKFKFNAKGGYASRGGVTVSGLGDDESVPKGVSDLLEMYGFSDGDRKGNVQTFCDSCYPDGMLEEDIDMLASIADINICSRCKRKKNGNTIVTYHCYMETCKPSKNNLLTSVVGIAHAVWNRAGRPIDGVPLKAAMAEVLGEINEKRV